MGDVIVLRLQQDDLLSITCFKRRHTCTQHSCFFFFFLEVKKRNNLDLFPIALKVSVYVSCQVIS